MIDTGLHDAILLTPKPKDPGIFFNRTSKTPMWVIRVFAKFFVLFKMLSSFVTTSTYWGDRPWCHALDLIIQFYRISSKHFFSQKSSYNTFFLEDLQKEHYNFIQKERFLSSGIKMV